MFLIPGKRWMLAALWAVLACQAHASDAEQAVNELRRFCLAEVCLGSSIEETRALGVLEAVDMDRRKGRCEEHDVATTSLQLPDGSRAFLGFRGYPLAGGQEMRYRLVSISRRLSVNPGQLSYLSQRVTDRYAMKRDNRDAGRWVVTTPIYEVFFQSGFEAEKSGHRQADVILHAEHRQFMSWVFEQPECSAALPRL